MLKTAILAATAALMVVAPTAAEAKHRHRGHAQNYYGNNYIGNGYDNGYYGNGYNSNGYNSYGNGNYANGYDDRYDRNAYYGQRQRCGGGTTGLIVGGAAGALLGREVGRSRDRYGYRGRNGTTGAIIGGALGALVGREVTKRC